MNKQNYPDRQHKLQEQARLKAEIQALSEELMRVEQETLAFEAKLRAILIDLIIEEQELSDLYRRMQKAKKEKRLEQKKRGKNYKEPQGLKTIPKQKLETSQSIEIEKEKKRLYREAMLHVHPDKFSTNDDQIDLATEITGKLIDIYKSGSLRELQAFHSHIFSGNALLQTSKINSKVTNSAIEDHYLQLEKEALEKKLAQAKNRQTYRVLKDYENPMLFAEELKAYYTDRLFKLRKRTRKAQV
ncbi:hypothetical protein EO244_11435 [Ancylomarina salipaludis]|uniref:J domain-containing protein n=1 Tax=Ancylomarina salipaludis TaxID=2501299 RepID=A0A4Q1JKZ4_9BACT|nr:hypothetical protein [Ancylomarina salipaludis]RXQ92155.1 hypothetical protein EO244_11435 [Ancylomarina salipaludis]